MARILQGINVGGLMRIIIRIGLGVLFMVMLAVLVMAYKVTTGCGGTSGGASPVTPSDVPVAIEALDGATDVAVDKPFEKTFGQTPDCTTVEVDESVDEPTFFIVVTPSDSSDACNVDNKLGATVTCNAEEGTADLDPIDNLMCGAGYTICLTSGILNADGTIAFESGYSVSFTTEACTGAIAVSPATAYVSKGGTQQFVAVDQDGNDVTSSVTWRVIGGDNNGTMSSAGLYTAPSTIPDGGITITAMMEGASATVTVTVTVGATLTFAEKSVPTTSGADCASGYIFCGIFTGNQATVVDDANNSVYLAWGDACDATEIDLADTHLYVSRTTDGGEEFTRSDEVASHLRIYSGSNPLSFAFLPAIIPDSGELDLAYYCITPDMGDKYATQFARSTDASELTFPTPADVGLPDSTVDDYQNAYMAVDSNGIIYMAIWAEGSTGSGKDITYYSKIYLKKSADSGLSWTNIEVDAYDDSSSINWCMNNPKLAIDSSDNVYVVYNKVNDGDCMGLNNVDNNKGSVWLARYNGNVVLSPVQINSDEDSSASNLSPAIAIDSDGVIHAVWMHQSTFRGAGTGDDGTITIYYAKSEDGGATFTGQTVVDSAGKFSFSGGANSLTYQPAIAVDPFGNINMAYHKCESSNCADSAGVTETMNIYVARKRSGEDSFDDPVQINTTSGTRGLSGSLDPLLSLDTDSHGRLYLTGGLDTDSDNVIELIFAIGE